MFASTSVRRFIALSVLLCLPAAAHAVLVDDFQTYSVGTVASGVTGGVWGAVGTTTVAPAVESSSGSLVLSLSGTGQSTAWRTLPTPIADNTTATVFMRVRANTTSPDVSFGLSDVNPIVSAGDFSAYETQFRLLGTDMEGRNAGTFVDMLPTGTVTTGTWYNVWLVVDTTTDTWDGYVNTGTADATPGDLLASDFAFRNGVSANPLTTLNFMAGGSGNLEASLDDIHFSTGVDLNNYSPIPPLAGDVNQNGVVDLVDFGIIRDHFQLTGQTYGQGNLDFIGRVDFADFRIWKTAFLGGGGSLEGVNLNFLSGVPEPSSFGLAFLAATVWGMAARRRTV